MRRYSSFLVRHWQLSPTAERVEVEHVQSGRRISLPSLAAVKRWMEEAAARKEEGDGTSRRKDMPDQAPRVDALLDAPGEACATLTPLIRARMRELESGRVLEVRSDDPAAREGVPAWSRLTGNELLATIEEDAQRTRFFLRKK